MYDLLEGGLVITGAIGACVRVILFKNPSTTLSTPEPIPPPSDSIKSFFNALVSVSGECLDDKKSP
jgi:hypothetical protein